MSAPAPASTVSHSQPGRVIAWGTGLLLSGLLLLIWRNALLGDFHFDDYTNIVENQSVRSLWPLDSFLASGRPFGLYTFALNYHFGQLDPHGYRVTNLLIHLANVLLLYTGILWSCDLMRKSSVLTDTDHSRQRWIFLSATIALLWGIHPLTTQAVTNIAQRYEALATLGYLGAWVGLLTVVRGSRWGLLLILLSAWTGQLSKEIFATAPLVIVLFDRALIASSWREIVTKRWLSYLLMITPFVWFIPSVLRWFDPQRSSSMGFGLKSVSAWEYLRTQPEVIFHYLGLSVWPNPLCFDYVWRIQKNPLVYLSLGAAILAILGTGGWLYTRGLNAPETQVKGRIKILAGWMILSFFLMLAPTSSIMPISDLCVEHRMYLPLAVVISGLSLLVYAGVSRLERRSERPLILRCGFLLILLSALAFLGWQTDLRNCEYRNGIALWNSVLKVRPDNPRAWIMLGTEYFRRNQFCTALPFYKKAVSFGMPVAEFHAGYANCLRELNRTTEAISQYERAILLKPEYSIAYNKLGALKQSMGKLSAARELFQTAMDQGLPEARYNLANVLIEQKEFSAAVPLLEECLKEHPHFNLPARRLAWILASAPDDDLRNGPLASDLLARHFQIEKSDSLYLWDTHAAVLAELGKYDQAAKAAEKAITLADSKSNETLRKDIKTRLDCYRQHRPWREGKSS
ncbi:Tetratricopeptide repeat protein [Gimesia maris]|uniref:tetratricopeptide repeat protein n=1 Tax=Gimesia maris TaxID=122 RepID=UPI00118B589B|nr:tetratricopeptide repeat protein [Gimesia maris]QDU16206.1 Tetratricopeptide repeat protein [Gimesia maris]